ncbi:MAG: ribonuclease P protein component [Paludibacteraceae bacterium]|nr:ribonuclease P protein component [Paludibacteraceae bacterium]
MVNGFPKHNRLCGQVRIAQLYKEGKRFVVWPLRVTYQPIAKSEERRTKSEEPRANTQVLVWAPKSLFKRAVKRNRLRRLMREAYRLNQNLLGEQHYLIAFNYIDKEEQPFATINKAICKSLKKISEQS